MNTRSTSLSRIIGILATALPAFIPNTALAADPPEMVVTGVQATHSSAKIYFQLFPGARDYRAYDITNPNDVKYAGLIHLTADSGCTGDKQGDANNTSCWYAFNTNPDGTLKFPLSRKWIYPDKPAAYITGYDGPSFFIDYNGLGDGKEHTLVVEALDAQGPVAYTNLYKEIDIKAFAPLVPIDHSIVPMPMMGSNKGKTQDGKISTNGQGPYTNNPNVIARSKPFKVTRNAAYSPILPGASQVFFDTFEDAQAPSIVPQTDVATCEAFINAQEDRGGREWTMRASNGGTWRLIGRQIDCEYTAPFIMSNHFMDILADREATIYGSLSMTPDKTFSLNGGILHFTQEIDDTIFGDRWMDFNVAPADDPLVHWNHQDKALNTGNQWLSMMNFGHFGQGMNVFISNGPANNPATPGNGSTSPVFGADGRTLFDPLTFAINGLGFDVKRRWDFFLSKTWAAFFIEGRLVAQGPIPADKAAWLDRPLKAYFTHYSYHSEAGWKSMLTSGGQYPPGYCNIPAYAFWFNDPVNGIKAGTQVTAIVNGARVPANGYGINNCRNDYPSGFGFRNTDERHWDNMAVSVLPSSITSANDFSSLGALIQTPPVLPPDFTTTPTPPAPVDCVVSPAPPAWGPDTKVSTVTNQDGSVTTTWQHSRTIVTPPANGGAACPATSETWVVVTPPVPPVDVPSCFDDPAHHVRVCVSAKP